MGFFLTDRHNFHIAVFKIDFFHKNEEKNVFFLYINKEYPFIFHFLAIEQETAADMRSADSFDIPHTKIPYKKAEN